MNKIKGIMSKIPEIFDKDGKALLIARVRCLCFLIFLGGIFYV